MHGGLKRRTARRSRRWGTALCAVLSASVLAAQTEGPPEVSPPPPVGSLQLDTQVVEEKGKGAAESLAATPGAVESAKVVSVTQLDQRIGAGDLQAALQRAQLARKNGARASDLPNVAAIEALFDQGIGDGIAEAFLEKAKLELDRESYAIAI